MAQCEKIDSWSWRRRGRNGRRSSCCFGTIPIKTSLWSDSISTWRIRRQISKTRIKSLRTGGYEPGAFVEETEVVWGSVEENGRWTSRQRPIKLSWIALRRGRRRKRRCVYYHCCEGDWGEEQLCVVSLWFLLQLNKLRNTPPSLGLELAPKKV